jgi:UPF0271 protein
LAVSINSDLGESLGIHSFGNDEALLPLVDWVNVACGMHSGDPSGIARTVSAAAAQGVEIGAHPGLPDLVGFGRREMALDAVEVRDLVRYQVGALTAFTRAMGVDLHHLKPHGALYAMVARREDLMDAMCDVAVQYGVPVLGLAGTAHETVARRRGVDFVAELYVDLDYDEKGMLIVPRRGTTKNLDDVEARVRLALAEGTVVSRDGQVVPVRFDSICVHSDIPGAPQVAERVRTALGNSGSGAPA